MSMNAELRNKKKTVKTISKITKKQTENKKRAKRRQTAY